MIEKYLTSPRDYFDRQYHVLSYLGLVKLFSMTDKIACIRREKRRDHHYTSIHYYFQLDSGEYITSKVKIRVCNFSRYVTTNTPLIKTGIPRAISGYSFQSYWIVDRYGSLLVYGAKEPDKTVIEDGKERTFTNRDFSDKLFTFRAEDRTMPDFKSFLTTLKHLDVPGIDMIKSDKNSFIKLTRKNLDGLVQRYKEYYSRWDYKLIADKPAIRFITEEMVNNLGLDKSLLEIDDGEEY